MAYSNFRQGSGGGTIRLAAAPDEEPPLTKRTLQATLSENSITSVTDISSQSEVCISLLTVLKLVLSVSVCPTEMWYSLLAKFAVLLFEIPLNFKTSTSCSFDLVVMVFLFAANH